MERQKTFNSLRHFIERCRNQEIIISVHNREEFEWPLDACLDYLNGALCKEPHIGHIMAYFVGYNNGDSKLRGNVFSSDIEGSRVQISDTPNIDLQKENSKNIIEFDLNNRGFIKDGRHKTQLFIWLCYGCPLIFDNNKRPIRFYQTFDLRNSNDGLLVRRSKIEVSSRNSNWYINKDKSKLSILYSSYDKLIYPEINPNLFNMILKCLDDYNISVENLGTALFAEIVNSSVKSLLYDTGDISSKVIIQEDNITGCNDAEISSYIRNMQKGKTWTEFEILKNHGECTLGFTGFKKDVKDEAENFVGLEFQDRNTAKFQLDVFRFLYSMVYKKGITDTSIVRECDMDHENIRFLIGNFKDISKFARIIFSRIKRISPSFTNRTYMRAFALPFSLMFHLSNNTDMFIKGDWVVNSNLRYMAKLIIKLSFKLFPQKGDRNEIGKHLFSILSTKFNNPPILNRMNSSFDQQEYYLINNAIEILASEYQDFNWRRITYPDIISNLTHFQWFMYGKSGYPYDQDHSLSEKESTIYYQIHQNEEEKKEYNNFWKESIYNMKPLHYNPNRSSNEKGDKNQYEYYIEMGNEHLAQISGIDTEAIKAGLSPLERMKANKQLFDMMIIERFKMFGFNDVEIDLRYPVFSED